MVGILLSGDLKRILTISLTIGVLILAFSVIGLGQEMPGEEQTPSEQAKIGYRNVGSIMSSVSGADVDKSALVKVALSNLFEELAGHMEDKGVPDHVVEKFRDRAGSLEAISEELTKEQLGSEASNIVQSAGREDPGGGVPLSVLEKAGLEKEDLEELTEKGPNKEKATQAVRNMARKDEEEDEVQSQDRDQDSNGNEGKPDEAGGQKNNDKGKRNGNDENEAVVTEDKGQEKDNQGNGSDKAGTTNQKDEEKSGNSDKTVGSDETEGNNGNPPDNRGKVDEEDKDEVKGEKGNSENPGRGNSDLSDEDDKDKENNGRGNGNGKGNGKGK